MGTVSVSSTDVCVVTVHVSSTDVCVGTVSVSSTDVCVGWLIFLFFCCSLSSSSVN